MKPSSPSLGAVFSSPVTMTYDFLFDFDVDPRKLWPRCIRLTVAVLHFLIPTFVLDIWRHCRSPGARGPSRPPGPTAYLDGLRGVAAFIVYLFHWGYLWYPFLRNGYGSTPDDHLFWQLPIVRVLHSGRSSVTVFFVISGYVLTVKTVSQIHTNQKDKVLDTLAGSLFRRPFRLYLPILVSTFMIAVVMRFPGLYIRDPSGMPMPPIANNFQDQVVNWWRSMLDLMNPFRNITARDPIHGNDYDGHLWTIPVEFKGSLMVFTLLLMFCRAQRWVHMVAVGIACWWQVSNGDFDQTLFCVGLLLAEVAIVFPAEGLLKYSRQSRLRTTIHHIATLALFFAGLHLFAHPEVRAKETPGYRHLCEWVPAWYYNNESRTQQFWNSIGAIIFIPALMYSPPVAGSVIPALPSLSRWRRSGYAPVADRDPEKVMEIISIEELDTAENERHTPAEPLLQRLFTNPVAQYLGRISYPLYLLHDLVNHTVGILWLSPAFGTWLDMQRRAKALAEAGDVANANAVLTSAWSDYLWQSVPGMIVNTLVLLWASDVFLRAVDIPAVKLTRKLGQWAWSKN